MRDLFLWLGFLWIKLCSVSEEEISHWHEGFLKDCPTGKLTKNEFAKIYNQFFPHGDPSAFAE